MIKGKGEHTNDPEEKVRWKMIEASLEGTRNLVKSEKALNEAIKELETIDPYNPAAANARQKMADTFKKALSEETEQKRIDEKEMPKPQECNVEKQKEMAQKCRKNYERAIKIMEANS